MGPLFKPLPCPMLHFHSTRITSTICNQNTVLYCLKVVLTLKSFNTDMLVHLTLRWSACCDNCDLGLGVGMQGLVERLNVMTIFLPHQLVYKMHIFACQNTNRFIYRECQILITSEFKHMSNCPLSLVSNLKKCWQRKNWLMTSFSSNTYM